MTPGLPGMGHAEYARTLRAAQPHLGFWGRRVGVPLRILVSAALDRIGLG